MHEDLMVLILRQYIDMKRDDWLLKLKSMVCRSEFDR